MRTGQALHEFAARLFPIGRSLTGKDIPLEELIPVMNRLCKTKLPEARK